MLDATLNIYRAVGEETRLRIAILLSRGELTVTELTQILGQSQPRVSRHLKILADACLVERYREGAWMFYRLAGRDVDIPGVSAVQETLNSLASAPDRVLARDRERFVQSREARAAVAAAYFECNAAEWDRVRKLHLPESDIETQILKMVGSEKIDRFVDLGTGTGRMLSVFADLYKEGIGYDASRGMLSVARANLDSDKIDHAKVRHGDIFALPAPPASADLVCIHQVLHFLAEPGLAVREAARLLKPGGRIIISDFAPHDLEFLRDEHAHRRLGFADDEVRDWCVRAGLNMVATKTLSPQNRSDHNRLTVKIWLCAFDVAQSKRYKANADHQSNSAKKSIVSHKLEISH